MYLKTADSEVLTTKTEIENRENNFYAPLKLLLGIVRRC